MVNAADKGLRLVDISLVAIYFREKSLVGPSQVSRHVEQYEQNQVWTALLEPDIASETAVLLSRPPQPLLGGAPSEEDNLLRATKPKKVV